MAHQSSSPSDEVMNSPGCESESSRSFSAINRFDVSDSKGQAARDEGGRAAPLFPPRAGNQGGGGGLFDDEGSVSSEGRSRFLPSGAVLIGGGGPASSSSGGGKFPSSARGSSACDSKESGGASASSRGSIAQHGHSTRGRLTFCEDDTSL